MSDRTFSVRRGLVLGFITLAILCGGLFGWGVFASLSGAVIATGRVEAEGGDRAVEHVDGGTVAEILARDGDRVATGAVLVRIDGALLVSEAAVLEAELFDLVARRNRLEAEFEDADAIVWDRALAAAADTSPAVRAAVEGHRRLFDARRARDSSRSCASASSKPGGRSPASMRRGGRSRGRAGSWPGSFRRSKACSTRG